MEGFVEGMEGGTGEARGYLRGSGSQGGQHQSQNGFQPRRTCAGSGSAAMAGLVAAQASGDAEVTSPVHAYGTVELVSEADDLLSSHMAFMHR